MMDKVMTIPVIALRGLAVLPTMMVHFDISRKKSVDAVEKAMASDQKVFLVAQKSPDVAEPSIGDLYHIGSVAQIRQMVKMPGGVIRVMAEGTDMAELLFLESTDPLLEGQIGILPENVETGTDPDPIARQAMVQVLKDKLREYGSQNPRFGRDCLPGLLMIRELGELMLRTAVQVPWDYTVRQEYMEAIFPASRYELLVSRLMTEIQVDQIKQEFQEKVKDAVNKNQKDYILREQMRVIRQELGEDNPSTEADEYREQVKQLKADKETKDKLSREIDRFAGMPASSQEAYVLRTYIETLLELPWKKASRDNEDIMHAQKILNEDHYGLDKVKERVLEYLAVRTLTRKGSGPILCLVGPPGTGKTSIARSVARALNKKYVRISLGGVRDEAEIRGHRKTYVGAMPGRLAEGLRQAGVCNPLMLLDEIDKVGSDYRGDTSSALLEVLDGEQNCRFRDHYVETPIDLSQVLFIATANTVQTIPRPLLDRMEVIQVSSYTENEKFHIGKDYLIGKQLEKNGLTADQLVISDAALRKIIHNYTREAGVRNLERRIGDICRKAAREYLESLAVSKTKKRGAKTAAAGAQVRRIRVTEANLEKYLGKEMISFENASEEDQVGIVRGLAWTSVGGDTLQIEVNTMPGKGEMLLTGQMGDVMKESAQIAMTYVRSVCPGYGVDDQYFEKHNLHIHIPEGAVAKDGPSAGITMATAMLSAVAKRPVDCKLAMTGEITLRGRVLPVGGLKEKILAARMAGIRRVLVPEKNKPDIAELSGEITRGLEIVFVSDMEQVLKEAFRNGKEVDQ